MSEMPFCPAGPHTHSLEDACILIGCESSDWIVDRVRNGTFPARRVVRQLRFSDEDISNIIEACAVHRTIQMHTVPVPTRSRKTG